MRHRMLLLALLCAAACQAKPESKEVVVTGRILWDPTGQYSVQLPANWKVKGAKQGEVELVSKDGVDYDVGYQDQERTVNAHYKESFDEMKSGMKDLIEESKIELTIGGLKAIQAKVVGTEEGRKTPHLITCIVGARRTYTLDASCTESLYQDNVKDMQAMAASFQERTARPEEKTK